MFDIGFLEVIFLATIALVVIGPEKLPHAARMTGSFIGMIKRHFNDFKYQVESEINAKELEQRVQQAVKENQTTINNLTSQMQEPINQDVTSYQTNQTNTQIDQSKSNQVTDLKSANLNHTPNR